MDSKNHPIQHLIVGIISLTLVSILHFLLNIPWSTSFGRTSYILLFFVLIIGPGMRLKKPAESSSPFNTPWSWRGELGIYFALTALTHFIILLFKRSFFDYIKIGGGGYSLTNSLGFIALFLALLLAATSSRKVIIFMGVRLWKWLHSLTYVVFYLASMHFIYFQFFSTYGEVGPDWFGYTAITMTITVITLQFSSFIVAIKKHRKSLV
jgi:methionine sulfoxide reductase heme-binding subunit